MVEFSYPNRILLCACTQRNFVSLQTSLIEFYSVSVHSRILLLCQLVSQNSTLCLSTVGFFYHPSKTSELIEFYSVHAHRRVLLLCQLFSQTSTLCLSTVGFFCHSDETRKLIEFYSVHAHRRILLLCQLVSQNSTLCLFTVGFSLTLPTRISDATWFAECLKFHRFLRTILFLLPLLISSWKTCTEQNDIQRVSVQ